MVGQKTAEMVRVLTIHGPPGLKPAEICEKHWIWPTPSDTIIIAEHDLSAESWIEEEWLGAYGPPKGVVNRNAAKPGFGYRLGEDRRMARAI
jgi:hypothetical protein